MEKSSISNIVPSMLAYENLLYLILNYKKNGQNSLPSERELSALWNINRSTIRSALDELVFRGILYKKDGIGTYISDEKINRNLRDLDSMTSSMLKKGMTVDTKVLSFRIIESTNQISNKLKIPKKSPVYELIRLRKVNGISAQIETNYLSTDLVQKLDNFDFNNKSLYAVLENNYNIKPTAGVENISVTYLTKEESYHLDVPEGESVFFVSGITIDDNNKNIEYYKSLLRKDLYYLSSHFKF